MSFRQVIINEKPIENISKTISYFYLKTLESSLVAHGSTLTTIYNLLSFYIFRKWASKHVKTLIKQNSSKITGEVVNRPD